MYIKPIQSLVGGIVGITVMTFILSMATLMDLPEFTQPMILSEILESSYLMGWVAYYGIGIIFAACYIYLFLPIYTYLFQPIVTIENKMFKGAIFGLFVYVSAQITLVLMSSIIIEKAISTEATLPFIIRNVLGYMIFGIYVGLSAKDPVHTLDTSYSKT